MIDRAPPESGSTPCSHLRRLPLSPRLYLAEVARGAQGRAFGALCCQRKHPTPKRLSRFWRNPDLRTQNWDIGAFLLAHSPLGATRQRRLFPGNPSLPPSKEVLAGAGLRTGRLQGTEHWGSKPPRVKLIINLCWWELDAFGFGNCPGAGTEAGMTQGCDWEMRVAEAPGRI